MVVEKTARRSVLGAGRRSDRQALLSCAGLQHAAAAEDDRLALPRQPLTASATTSIGVHAPDSGAGTSPRSRRAGCHVLDLLQVVVEIPAPPAAARPWQCGRPRARSPSCAARYARRCVRPGRRHQRRADLLIVEFGVDRASPANTTVGRRPHTAAGSAVITWVTPGRVTDATATCRWRRCRRSPPPRWRARA